MRYPCASAAAIRAASSRWVAVFTEPFNTTVLVSWKVSTLILLASTVRSAMSADFTSIVSTAALSAPPASRDASLVSAAASRPSVAAFSELASASFLAPAAVFEHAARERPLIRAIARYPFFKLIRSSYGPRARHCIGLQYQCHADVG